MNKKIKLILAIASIVAFAFFIKSRIVSQSNFDLMVLMDTTEVLENCNKRLEAESRNIIDSNIEENYYIKVYGDDICTNPSKLKQIIEDDHKERLKDNWLILF